MGKLNATTIRASASLAAAGAYDTSPTAIGCPNADQADFWLGFTRGSATSKVTLKVETAVTISGTDYWFKESPVIMTGTLSQGADVSSQTQDQVIEFKPTGATQEFIRVQCNNINADKIRINVKESGDTANPGTCVIYIRTKVNSIMQ